jgi:protein-tyrosine phosphatase
VSPNSGEVPSPFHVLLVCTANICRSPAAEVLLRRLVRPGSGITVASAGVHARVGEPMALEMAGLLDIPPETVVARQFTAEAARGADLVLTMTRAHRASVVTSAPAAIRRTFTLREFGDLAGLVDASGVLSGRVTPAERLAGLTGAAPRFRSQRSDGPDDDVEDPYGRDAAAYARALDVLRQSLSAVGTIVAP